MVLTAEIAAEHGATSDTAPIAAANGSHKFWRVVAPLGLFLVIAVIFLLPGSVRPGVAPLGYAGDSFQHAWFLWHFAHAVAHGQNPFRTNLLYFPNDVNLAWSTTDPLAATLALPASLTAGPIAAYNLSLILQLALSGFFAYLLCLRITESRIAAVIGGACFGFSPFLLGEALGHLSLVTAFPIPLYFLALDRVLRARVPGWRDGILLGFSLFLTALAHYNYTVFCTLLSVVILCVDLALDGRTLIARVTKALAVGAVTFALLFLPFFLMMWADPASRPRPRTIDQVEGHSADTLGYFVPSWNHILYGRFSRHWNPGLFTAGYEGTNYLGPMLLLLAAVGVWAGLRHRSAETGTESSSRRHWTIRALAAALVFAALSFGPHIRMWGHDTGIPGPEYLLYASPFARFISAPARFDVITILCVAMLAAIGVAWLLGRMQGGAPRALATAAICMLLAVDLLTVPFPVATSAASAASAGFGVATEGCHLPVNFSGRTVVTIPMLDWPYPDRAMWMQLTDGGRYALADGYVSYGPDSMWQEFWHFPILRSLRSLQADPAQTTLSAGGIDPRADRATLAAAIHQLNLGAFVVYDFPQRHAVQRYLEQLLGSSGQAQESCTVFEIPRASSVPK
jgi:hypothetical protein